MIISVFMKQIGLGILNSTYDPVNNYKQMTDLRLQLSCPD
jgi:hypothetical protein